MTWHVTFIHNRAAQSLHSHWLMSEDVPNVLKIAKTSPFLAHQSESFCCTQETVTGPRHQGPQQPRRGLCIKKFQCIKGSRWGNFSMRIIRKCRCHCVFTILGWVKFRRELIVCQLDWVFSENESIIWGGGKERFSQPSAQNCFWRPTIPRW